MAHFRRKHSTGRPSLRKKSSDYRYQRLEKGSSKRGPASIRRSIESAESTRDS